MSAKDLYEYLDDLRDKEDLDRVSVFITEKTGLFGVRPLSSAVLVSPRGVQSSLVLCPVPLTRTGEEIENIFGEYDDAK